MIRQSYEMYLLAPSPVTVEHLSRFGQNVPFRETKIFLGTLTKATSKEAVLAALEDCSRVVFESKDGHASFFFSHSDALHAFIDDYFKPEQKSLFETEESVSRLLQLSEARKDMARNAGELHRDFSVLLREYKRLTDDMVDRVSHYERQLRRGFGSEPLRALARVTRTAEQSGSDLLRQLERVMLLFGCEPIQPEEGEPFNTFEHTYYLNSQIGCKTVHKTVVRGWKSTDDVLLTAEVEAY